MTADDLAVVVKGIAPVVREYVSAQLDGLKAQVATLEQRLAAADQKAVDLDALAHKAAALVPVPKDGKDAAPVDLDALAQQAAALVPAPKDGKDGASVALSDLDDAIAEAVTKAVAALPPAKNGQDGASVDPDDVDRIIAERVHKAVTELPTPKDGASVTVDDVAPLIAAEVTKQVAALPVPKDGIGMMSALVDRAGHLMLTLSDGATKDLGLVVGKDVDMAEVSRYIAEAVAKFPAPKDGIDGLGFDDLSVTHDGERLFTFTFTRGEQVKAFPFTLPIPIYRGVFTDDKAYGVNDVVTWGGAMWIAKMDTTIRPSLATDAREWQMCVKEGRKGKDGKDGEAGPAGKSVVLPTPAFGLDGRKL